MSAIKERLGRVHEFDVFVSFNSSDLLQVRKMVRRLRRNGIRPWFDEEELFPSSEFEDALISEMERTRCALICIGASGLGKYQRWEVGILAREAKRRGIPLMPVLLEDLPAGEPKLPESIAELSELNRVDFRLSADEPDPFYRLLWGISKVTRETLADALENAGAREELEELEERLRRSESSADKRTLLREMMTIEEGVYGSFPAFLLDDLKRLLLQCLQDKDEVGAMSALRELIRREALIHEGDHPRIRLYRKNLIGIRLKRSSRLLGRATVYPLLAAACVLVPSEKDQVSERIHNISLHESQRQAIELRGLRREYRTRIVRRNFKDVFVYCDEENMAAAGALVRQLESGVSFSRNETISSDAAFSDAPEPFGVQRERSALFDPWFDPSKSFDQPTTEQAIRRSRVALVCIGGGMADREKIFELNMIRREMERRSLSVIPVYLDNANNGYDLPSHLNGFAAHGGNLIDFRQPGTRPLKRLIWSIQGGKRDQLLRTLDEAPDRSANDAIILTRVRELWENRDIDGAITALNEKIEADETDYGTNSPITLNTLESFVHLAFDIKNRRGRFPASTVDVAKRLVSSVAETFDTDFPQGTEYLRMLGLAHLDLGQYREAVSYLEKALRIRGRVFSNNDPRVATSLNSLGTAYNLRDHKESRNENGIDALTDIMKHLDRRIINDTSIIIARNDKQRARICHKIALALANKLPAEGNLIAAISLANLGSLALKEDNIYLAKERYEQAIAALDKNPQGGMALRANARHALGWVLHLVSEQHQFSGDIGLSMLGYQQAVDHLRKSLDIRVKRLRSEDPAILTNIETLRFAFILAGKVREGEEYFVEIWSLLKESHGENNSITKAVHAIFHGTQADPVLKEAVEHFRRGESFKNENYSKAKTCYGLALENLLTLPRSHTVNQLILSVYSSLGDVCEETMDFTGAMRCYDKIVSLGREQILPRGSYVIVHALMEQGKVCLKTEDLFQAIDFYLEALEVGRQAGYEDHPIVEAAQKQLAGLTFKCFGQGFASRSGMEASKYVAKGIEIIESYEAGLNITLNTEFSYLASIPEHLDSAENYYEKLMNALQSESSVNPSSLIVVADIIVQLARNEMIDRGGHSDDVYKEQELNAASLYFKALKIIQERPTPNARHVAEIMNRIDSLLISYILRRDFYTSYLDACRLAYTTERPLLLAERLVEIGRKFDFVLNDESTTKGAYEEALSIYRNEEGQKEETASVLSSLGSIAYRAGNVELSIERLKEALVLRREIFERNEGGIQSALGLTNSLSALGELMYEALRFEESIDYYNELLEVCEPSLRDDTEFLAERLQKYGLALIEAEKGEVARPHLLRALTMNDYDKMRNGETVAKIKRALETLSREKSASPP